MILAEAVWEAVLVHETGSTTDVLASSDQWLTLEDAMVTAEAFEADLERYLPEGSDVREIGSPSPFNS